MGKGLFYAITIPFALVITILRCLQLGYAVDDMGLVVSSDPFSIAFNAVLVIYIAVLCVMFFITRKSKQAACKSTDMAASAGCVMLIFAFFIRSMISGNDLLSSGFSAGTVIKTTVAVIALGGAFYMLALTRGTKLTKSVVILSVAPSLSLALDLVMSFVAMTENSQISDYVLSILFILSSICALFLFSKRMFYIESGRACSVMASLAVSSGVAQAVSTAYPDTQFFSQMGIMQKGETLSVVLIAGFFILSTPYFSKARYEIEQDGEDIDDGDEPSDTGDEEDRGRDI